MKHIDIDIRDSKLHGQRLAEHANLLACETQRYIMKPHPDRLLVTTEQYNDLATLFGIPEEYRKTKGMIFKTKLGYIMEVTVND